MRPAVPIHTVIKEKSINELIFNVMPEKPVKEILFVKEYRLGDNYIEALFDRQYMSSMAASPSHLIFLSTLIHWQKLVYVYFCHYLKVTYEPNGPEKVKIWPTKLKISLPELIREEEGLIQKFWIDEIKPFSNGAWKIWGETRVSSMVMSGETVVFPTPSEEKK